MNNDFNPQDNPQDEPLPFRKSPNERGGPRRLSKGMLIAIYVILTALLCTAAFLVGSKIGKKAEIKAKQIATEATDTETGWNTPQYVVYKPIVENEYSRPGTKLEKIDGVVVHYVANPGTTASQNRSYFNGLAESGATWASSHFIIGIEGEVLQIIPLNEIAYTSNNRNSDTVSIECCHPEEDGKFSDATYSSLVKLTADLCREFDLDPRTDVIRHYDVTGKLCPLYFVEHEDAWREFLTDVAAALTVSK